MAAPTVDLDVSGASRMTAISVTAAALTTTGRVGVNRTAPTVDLDVSGASRMTAASVTAAALTTTGRVGVNMAAPTVDLDVSGASRMTAASVAATALTTTGRVGVNRAVPTADLDVNGAAKVSTILSAQTGLILGDNTRDTIDNGGDSNTGCLLNIIDTGINKKPRLRFVGNANSIDIGCSDYESFIWSKGDKALGIATNSVRRMTITNTGNVGIGIESATSLLHVNGASRMTAASATATALTTTGRVGVNMLSPTVDLDVTGAANVSNYLSVGSGGVGSGATTSNIPNAFYVRVGTSNWRDYIPLLVADSTTNLLAWGLDSQWYTQDTSNYIKEQYSYFAAYWLNANRAVVGTQFQVESFASGSGNPPSSRGIFTFTATTVTNGIVTGYTGQLSSWNATIYTLVAQQDGIDAGVARRSLSNRTLLMGGSVETGYLAVVGNLNLLGAARMAASSATATALTTTGRIGVNTATPTATLDVSGNARISGDFNVSDTLNLTQTQVAMGKGAGATSQGLRSVAIGVNAGNSGQLVDAVAIGNTAGQTNQSQNCVAIGFQAGFSGQSFGSVAIGMDAGKTSQQQRTVAIGSGAGFDTQGEFSIAIGDAAAQTRQRSGSVAIGVQAGFTDQSANSVAIGNRAGTTNQGANSVAIGNRAGTTNQTAGSICLNASGVALNPNQAGLFIDPIRNVSTTNVVRYNASTREVSYFDESSLFGVGTPITFQPSLTDSGGNSLDTGNYNIRTGFYIKIGRMVFYQATISIRTGITNLNSLIASNTLRFSLPATSLNQADLTQSLTVGRMSVLGVSLVQFGAVIAPNEAFMTFTYRASQAANDTTMLCNVLNYGTTISVGGSYIANS
jgi:hypothetical protein